MSRILTSDRPFSGSHRATLLALLDTLLPASDDGRMPSAAEVDFTAYLDAVDPAYIAGLEAVIGMFGPTFAGLDLPARVAEVQRFSLQDPKAFTALIQRVYDCYYRNERVRKAIGVNTGAPFPQGNQVAAGDLSLLDPVIRNADRHRFRPA